MGIVTLHRFTTGLAVAEYEYIWKTGVPRARPQSEYLGERVKNYPYRRVRDDGWDVSFDMLFPERFQGLPGGALEVRATTSGVSAGGRRLPPSVNNARLFEDYWHEAHLAEYAQEALAQHKVGKASGDWLGYMFLTVTDNLTLLGAVYDGFLRLEDSVSQNEFTEDLAAANGDFEPVAPYRDVATAIVEYLLYRVGTLPLYSLWETGEVTAGLVRRHDAVDKGASLPRSARSQGMRFCELVCRRTAWGQQYRTNRAMGLDAAGRSRCNLALTTPWDGVVTRSPQNPRRKKRKT